MNVEIVTILILDILVIGGLAAGDVIEYKSHTDNYDITTIYKTTLEYNDGEKINRYPFNISLCPGCYDAKIHLRTNAIGMPIEFNGSILSSDKKSLEFVADSKYSKNIFTQNQIEYEIGEWTISSLSMSDPVAFLNIYPSYELLLWKANNKAESFKIKWKQRNSIKMCISVSYLLGDESKCTFSMDLTDEDKLDKQIIYSSNIKESKILKTVLFKSNNWLYENKTYSLNFKLEKKSSELKMYNEKYKGGYYYQNEYIYKTVYIDGCKIGIKRIAQCTDDYENEEILTITAKELQKTPSASASLNINVYPFANSLQIRQPVLPTSECLNGGFADKNGCTCPPGFKGNKCEHGCGPNAFGADCTGICSIHKTHCRQMMFCTYSFGCKCPAGYRGYDCTTECENGTYGVNCEQKCSERCSSTSCDVYTGVCNKGCTTSYIAPGCEEKYPWLKSPPQLESSDFRSLKLKIDFNSENILGSNNVNSVYYQIIFKDASNESKFQYLELKELRQQKSVIEVIDDLKPGISYTFGVILVSEDGNYNIDDIKTVNYSTKCLMPRNINYDVNLLSGTDYINVTWNKINDKNEVDCKITEYLLKLMFNNTAATQQQSYSEEVKSNNNHGYVFENLLFGEKYAVQVTAISATAQLAIPSNISCIYTKPYGFVKIKNIKAKLNQSSSLIITWDVDEKYVNTAFTYVVKYKVNKHFSCSNEVITNNWTSLLVYNQTRREIWDLTPNTQYVIKVDPEIKGYTYNDYANVVFVKTPISTPKLTPVNDKDSSYITNQSAYFKWTINKADCSKLNGFFRGYQIILKDIVDGTQVENSVKQNTVYYDGLKPDTKYELQLYVLTNYGYNSEQGLLIPFKTKTKFLVPVDELIVYKKNLKNKSIGIRWSFPDENIINGFIVSVIDEDMNSIKEITIEPKRCVAWPKLYCTTFENLILNHQYTIKIKAKSIDYPTGGLAASVVSIFNDGFADKPENLRTTFVGFTHISLEWDIPFIFNGVLKSFIVNTEEISSKDIDKCCDSKPDIEIPITEELPTYNCTINHLKPGSTYSISVLSKTSLYGQTNRIHVTTLSTPAEADNIENHPVMTPETQISVKSEERSPVEED
ncbi:uncharacterized protein LOC100166399 [Acyrthosiphon pisum]|uniref:Fibronectin type-III domain-containing protein n=1 Tax=Acyrthosiphon pisum TaxID=7029 RepID=A0A8R2A248_ACYPI|nr:uncharacterized protein LOC100166399 [Acyrthosiphon pisum]|eukprot:XP_001943393.2 PREDICTED: uncharacterized protein LOC100166399 [Acyrthosiphon pisum]